MGGLSSRSKSNTHRIDDLEKGDDADGLRRGDIIERLVKLETRVDTELKHLNEGMAALAREVRGLTRQVSSLVTHGKGRIPPLEDAFSED